MANLKISGFTAASALDGTELLGGVQTAANAKITAAQVKTYCNTQGYIGGSQLYPNLSVGMWAGGGAVATASTLNAAGLKFAFMGELYIPGLAAGVTKTISAAGGGSLSFATGAVTFANGGTTLDVGVQGVSTSAGPPARPDDTFAVKRTLTGGTDTINATTENTFAMTGGSGSATLTNGALTAVVFDMTGRGGADSVIIRHIPSSNIKTYPCAQSFAAAAWAAAVVQSVPVIRITFDTGELGYLRGAQSIASSIVEAWNDGTNPDERGIILQTPVSFTASGIWLQAGVTDANSTFTYAVYSDPTGTPAALTGSTGTFDPHQYSGAAATDLPVFLPFSQEVTISKNTNYCIAIKATHATSNIRLLSWTASASANRTWFGNGTAGKTTRDGGAGAFAAASTTVGYYMGFMVNQFITG